MIFRRAAGLLLLCGACVFYKCPVRLLFHIDCPGCGMTRAVLSALRLDFNAAFRYHSLFPVTFVCAGYYIFRDCIYIGRRQERIALTVIAAAFIIRWLIQLFM
ncbi:MAG: DUF2752 domain-containing protein [Eubacteriales bacterium]|nr:DUF2752 domain-containing protein [Eubacteriales bacterium]